MLKKHLSVLTVFLAVLMLFFGCVPSDFHEVYVVPKDAIWDRNPDEHWINSKKGEKLHVAGHEFDEEGFCTVCKSFVEYWTDGGADVCNYDEKYNLTRSTSFDEEGNIFFDYVMEYRYGKNDEIIYCATYQNGRLYETYENIEGTVQKEYFEEDGTHSLSITYTGYLGDTIINQWYAYDNEDNVHYESYTETLLDENSEEYLIRETETDYKTGIKTVGEYDSYMNPLLSEEYDFDGNLLSRREGYYEYSDEGFLLYKKILLNGKPEIEVFFDAETFYETKKLSYEEDGSYTVTEYNEEGLGISNVHYDSDGVLVYESYNDYTSRYLSKVTLLHYFSEIKQITEYNANGDELSCKTYNFGDELLSSYDYVYEYGEENIIIYQKTLFNGNPESEYFFEVITENGELFPRLKKTVTYYENGSKLVREYDENGNEITTNYDAEGNIIE